MVGPLFKLLTLLQTVLLSTSCKLSWVDSLNPLQGATQKKQLVIVCIIALCLRVVNEILGVELFCNAASDDFGVARGGMLVHFELNHWLPAHENLLKLNLSRWSR